MKNWKVKTKLLTGFIVMAVLTCVVGVTGIIATNTSIGDSIALAEYSEVQIAMGELREMKASIYSDLYKLSVVCAQDNPAQLNATLASLAANTTGITNAFADYAKTAYDEVTEANFYAAKKAFEGDFAAFLDNVRSVAQDTRDTAQTYAAITAGANAAAEFDKYLQATIDDNINWLNEDYKKAMSDANVARLVPVGVIAVSVAVALFLAFYLSALISRPLVPLTAFMQKAASTGDLTIGSHEMADIERYGKSRDEIGKTIAASNEFIKRITAASAIIRSIADGDLTHDINVLTQKDTMGLSLHELFLFLNSMFAEINTSTYQVSTGSKQIADGAQSLAQGSTTQAASVQELSSSIADITEKTKTNAAMAQKAADLAVSIKGHAEGGSRQMKEMTEAVKEINDASGQIGKVIKVIDDIAFQTNILALNAAVEAARAGQQGKGFAVVAEEVRNLAAKSAEAAKNTESMIKNTVEKASLGVRIAGETADNFANIVSGINESDEIVSEIARSSNEQSRSIEQINSGIDQVAKVIQQNSATSQESAAASQEMSSQAALLQELIARFRLKGGEDSLPAARNRNALSR
ncbi:MAG: methyl-accepting chemotaxis protein [Oscillospiraceae bacterium]|jgi:methyl-accepting chemotaxis protein|nr:methyl-accepting chemotaxis protein [Oscillospiraceae bacterium]